MNQTAIEYFAKDWDNPQDEFNHGLSLFISASGSRNLIRSYNTKGYTEQNLEKLKYDLKKHTGITDQDIEDYKSTLSEDITDSQRNMEETIAENKDRFAVLLGALPEDAQKGMKLYGTYPFLRTKECPNEYKVLVGDAITAFEEYKAGHKELFEKVASVTEPMLTDEEIYQVANAVLENFDLNREIHEELQYYADKGEILGKHKIFEWYMKEKKISEMSAADLSKGFNNFKSYVSKSKTSLEKAETDEEKKEWEDHIANLEREKALYKKCLDGKK